VELDWRRLRAVVLESDDWGLCAWVPDDRAHRALARLPAFRSPAGLRYGRSTLEGADDVRALSATLLDWRGRDGFPPVWQANTIVANPDFDAMKPPAFEARELPLVELPGFPARWARPGLWDAVREAEAAGTWWAELHGLHHLPEAAWLDALRRGADDARRAFEQASPIAKAVEASGEYDASEPRELRARQVRRALRVFRDVFGRAPTSFCPPDYRFDDWFAEEAAGLGLTTWQGVAERAGRLPAPIRRRLAGTRFPRIEGGRFLLPTRIAFEPAGDADAPGPRGLAAAHRAARAAWDRGQPAIVSTHRMNYAHLDAEWSSAGRAALAALLERLCAEGATFLTDHEVRQLAERAWSVRDLAGRGALVRNLARAEEPLRFPAPAGVRGARVAEGADGAGLRVEDGRVEARLPLGETVLEWTRA
jgi:peptidoglycan/xylan/chitin deacetylase (PgdA/CDA1 family)